MKTEMNYEQKYKEALKKAKAYSTPIADKHIKAILANIFPELKESEDEKIRKEIIYHVQNCDDTIDEETEKRMIAWLEKQGHDGKKWIYEDVYLKEKEQLFQDGIDEVLENPQKFGLEKQGEQKTADKVEPKFKIGDWITNGEYTWKVTDIKPLDYILQSPNGNKIDDTISYVDEEFRLWTIQDAKDGDVLAIESTDNGYQYPFVAIYKKLGLNYFNSYCNIGFSGTFYINESGHCTDVHPATKEQHDLLFAKMKEAGYEWDAEKKELNEIEQPSWSEEDEKMKSLIISTLTSMGTLNLERYHNMNLDEVKKWLKSLKPQNHWKPSEEHLRVLQTAIKDYGICVEKNILESLYNDLKNL